ncbi:hypothetical protein [Frankia sp. AiPa1]|uniref:hypothetical protein n=1 Tax=Frankia sp. AiPa1 TaxID=573492 RepID=UPI00202B1C1F|nr:hypothetical protein [Frankia sp. AiPa1]MCL9759481.1 hypothetical protein [Frankia sp. AiPa1]
MGKLIPIRVAECPREGLLSQIASFDLFDLLKAEAKARLAEQHSQHVGRCRLDTR